MDDTDPAIPPVHVRLPREVLDALKARAASESRPISVMARILIQQGLATPEWMDDAPNVRPAAPSRAPAKRPPPAVKATPERRPVAQEADDEPPEPKAGKHFSKYDQQRILRERRTR